MMESEVGGILELCYLHLTSLSDSKDVGKFDLNYFEKLTALPKQFTDPDDFMRKCSVILLQLLEHCEKQLRLSCDVAYAFCLLTSFRCRSIYQLYTDITKLPELTPDSAFYKTEEMSLLLEKNSAILVSGMLQYLVHNKYEFSNKNEYHEFNLELKKRVFLWLSKQNDVNALLHIADLWLTLVDQQSHTTLETLEDVLTSAMSVVICHWNHHISEIRARVKRLSLKCLSLNYAECSKQTRCRNKLTVAVNMKLFKAFASDMFWSVPYKYFAYLIGLEFIAKFSSVSKFLICVKTDLHEGFTRSLRNKRVIGVETDLFKFCTNNMSFEDWKEVFHPLICSAMSTKSIVVANNFSRWLPVILRRFPEYSETVYSSIPANAADRTAFHSRILFALLKTCRVRRIQLPSDAVFFSYLEDCFFDAEDTRGELFALLCCLNEQSVLHSEQELKLILKFLRINAHSSSTILRQQLFSSFASMVLRLICSSVRIIKTYGSESESKLKHVISFLEEFNDFLLDGIEPGSSYQRVITSLTLYQLFMTYAICKCGREIRRNNLKDAGNFVDFMKERGSWKFTDDRNFGGLFRCLMDPCSEIQNLSFVLLRTYFDFATVEEPALLFSNALKILDDNQFYKRQSGVAAVLSCICLCYNSGDDAPRAMLKDLNETCSSFTDMFLGILTDQLEIMKLDILNSALYHPLDATIRILTYLMTDASSPECSRVTEQQVERLIGTLERIVPLLLEALSIDRSADYAPSFEESDTALQAIIEKSDVFDKLKIHDSREDEFQLKPVYQILLNFIWISLKVCCECESNLVVLRTQLNETSLIRCCNLIVKKLKLCRHKGVIEAAGIALSNVVQTLTDQNLCSQWLDSVLTDIIHLIEYKRAATISRKSAGLSLLIQNIVGSDKRPNKPLLMKCWVEFRRILKLGNYDAISDVSQELPQTHALHFLRVLIADARNSAHLSAYFEEITLLCIQTLNVPIWTVRNASLQLFGAILPKMVGQKNSQNDFGVRRSFEETFLFMPELLNYLVYTFEKLHMESSCQKLTAHSNLVPLLVMLSNVQVCSTSTMEKSLLAKLLQLRKYAKGLLNSELYFVRKFAGKAFISLHSANEIDVFKKINSDIVEHVVSGVRGENLLHGYLLLMKHAFSLYSELRAFQKHVIGNRLSFETEVSDLVVSLPCQTLLYGLEIGNIGRSNGDTHWESVMNHISLVLDKLSSCRHVSLGYDDWTYTLVNITFMNCSRSPNSLLKYLQYCLQSSRPSILENMLDVLADPGVPEELVNSVCPVLCNCMHLYLRKRGHPNKVSVLNRLFTVLIRWQVSVTSIGLESLVDNYELLRSLNYCEYRAQNLRVICLLMYLCRSRPADLIDLNGILEEIHKTLDAVRYNKDVRLNSAEAMVLLADDFHSPIVDLELVWTILTDLLQDEESEIRMIGCECFEKLSGADVPCKNPDKSLSEMFSLDFMKSQLPMSTVIRILWERLSISNFNEVFNEDITSPFDQGIGNTYKEDVKIISLAGQTLLGIIADEDGVANFSANLVCYKKCLEDMLDICSKIVKNKFLVSVPSYIIALKCYNLFSILFKLPQWRENGLLCDGGDTQTEREKDIRKCYISLRVSFNFEELESS